MQNTLPLTPSHPVKSLIGLARQIALPHEYAPQRFPSFPALERTALMGFCQPATLSLPASFETKVLLSRQACFPLWADQEYSSLYAYQVGYITHETRSLINDSGLVDVIGTNSWGVGNSLASINLAGVSGSISLGAYPVMGIDGCQVPFVWVPFGATLVVSVRRNSTVGAVTCRVTLDVWSAPGQFDTVSVAVAIAGTFQSGGLAVSSTGAWYRPSNINYSDDATATYIGQYHLSLLVVNGTPTITPSTTGMPTVTAVVTPFKQLLPLTYPAEFANSLLPWFAARTTAAAVLGSNVSQVLTKAGTILGGRVSPNVINPFTVGSSYVNTLHPAEKAWLPLETGVYTYCPPSTDLSSFWDYTSHPVNGAFVPAPLYRLDNDALVNVMYVTAGATAEQLAITLDWHLEFRTSSALFQIGLSTIPLEVLHQAQLSLTAAGFFFENPEHKSVLNKVMNAVKQYGPQVASIASAALPQYAAAFRGAKLLLPHATAMRMKPTNAVDSGIVPGKKAGRDKKKEKGNKNRKAQTGKGKKSKK